MNGTTDRPGWPVARCLLLTIPWLVAGCADDARPVETADLILTNGRLVTVDDARPEAEALAVRGGLILAVGSNDEIARFRGDATEVIDLAGRLAIPGFIEGHAHFTGLGQSLMIVDLRDAHGWDEVVARVAAAADEAPPGEWILGRGWHQEKWDSAPRPDVEGYPVHDRLSAATPDHPVALTHASGHAAIVNALALEAAGISDDTADPPGGTILRDADGRATGVLRETAEGLVERAIEARDRERSPQAIEERTRRQIELATAECLSNGVTSFQDAGSSFSTVDRLAAAAEDGTLGVRLWVMLNESNAALAQVTERFPLIDEHDQMLTVRAVKRVMDGALGSHGAWLLEPYSDLGDSVGLPTIAVEELAQAARIALDRGLQLCVHAIGDRANREVLDVFETAYAEAPDADLRWRVEHAQHLHPDDLPRFADLGVIASMQAVHCTSDGPWVPDRIGTARAATGAYMWRALLDSGAVVTNGTDAPVEEIDPIANFHASVTRRMRDGERFFPEQRMTREQALRSYTLDAAYAAFEEGLKGSLTPGKLADVTVLSRDIMTVPEEQILDAEVVYTIVGGRLAYRADGS
ncbi:MAG TPA: amidohydrolase [Candidatus Polarisedimenticolaceae bacterium]|nr:amidohydrolase [Candidatus Polarisedimenticolaceae bacterium]